MAALEKEVNLVLFVRHSRGLGLTKKGEEFLKICQDTLGHFVQRTDILREQDSEPTGTLKVVTGSGSLEKILRNLPIFSQKFPRLHFNFSSEINIYNLPAGNLQAGNSDVSIMPDNISDSEFVQLHLFDMQFRIYASPDYLNFNSKPKDLKDLTSHKLIMYVGEKQKILNKLLNIQDTCQPFLEVNSGPAMRAALIGGCGIGCYGYDKEAMENKSLVDIFPNIPDHIIPYYYTYHHRLEGSQKIQEFYNFLKKEVVNFWQIPNKK